jgi:hypothetical protein
VGHGDARRAHYNLPMIRKFAISVQTFVIMFYLAGLIALGAFAAPPIFSEAQRLNVQMPTTPAGMEPARYLGGETFGLILRHFAVAEIACCILLIVTFAVESTRIARRLHIARLILLIVLLGITGYDLFIQTPDVYRERAAWFAAAGHDQPAADAHRDRFDVLHHRSEHLGQAKVWLLLAMFVLFERQRQMNPRVISASDVTDAA